MWKVHQFQKEEDLKFVEINETIAVDSNFSEQNDYRLDRPLKNITSLFPNTLVIPNFSININDSHFKSVTDLSGSQKTIHELKYLLVCIDFVNNNLVGNVGSHITKCSGIFVIDNSFTKSTTYEVTEINNINQGSTATSPENIVLILKNVAVKRKFLPSLGSISHLKVKIMQPDGTEIVPKKLTLPTDPNKVFVLPPPNIFTATNPTGNTTFTSNITPAINNYNIITNFLIKLENVLTSEYRVVTNVNVNTITFNSEFTSALTVVSQVNFLKLPIMWHMFDQAKVMVKTSTFFSALDFKKGDLINITGSGIPFIDRNEGHIITDLTFDSGNANFCNIIMIKNDYSFGQPGTLNSSETSADTLFGRSFEELQSFLENKNITIKNKDNNYLLTIDADINIQDI